MLKVSIQFPDEIQDLQEEYLQCINNNVADVVDMYIDYYEDPYMDWDAARYFPDRFYVKNQEKAIDTIYELRNIIRAPYIYDDLTPLQSYVLYQFLEEYAEINNDYDGAFDFEAPEDLKKRIKEYAETLDDPDLNGEFDEILALLSKPDGYIDVLFEDSDFLDIDIRSYVFLAMSDPVSFKSMMSYEELDQYIEIMPTDVARKYCEFRKEIEERVRVNPENAIINTLLSALNGFHKRVVHYENEDEVRLTADLEDKIEVTLAEQYNIYTKREYNIGRALKALGETDLCFYKEENGKIIDIAILENKEIDRFKDQYLQLMGYLNPFFQFGITLSINRKYTLAEARNKIIEALKSIDSDFSVSAIAVSETNPNYLLSEHIVPETGKTMRIHHLILNLFDESRHQAAIEARQ